MLQAVKAEKELSKEAEEKYKKAMANKKTDEEHAQIFSRKKAQKKVDWFAKRAHAPLVIEGFLIFVLLLFFILCYGFKMQPFVDLITKSNETDVFSLKNFSVFAWIYGLFTVSLPTYFHKIWQYLSSDSRKEKLCSRYFKNYLNTLND